MYSARSPERRPLPAGGELGGPRPPRQRVEHGIDHPALFAPVKGAGDVDIFHDRDARRHVRARSELVIGRAQDRAHQGLDAPQRPSLGERVVETAVDRELIALHARDDVAEEGEFCGVVLIALDLLTDPMRLEFGENVGQTLVGDLHLVERLRGGEARGGAASGLAHEALSLRLSVANVSAARAASPPLSPRFGSARSSACASVSTVSTPLPRANRPATDRSISARADSPATISKWNVSPLTTQPSATAPSYGRPVALAASSAMAIAAGISSAPGTPLVSVAAPPAAIATRAPSNSRAPTAS